MKRKRKQTHKKPISTSKRSITLVLVGVSMVLALIGIVFVFEASSINALNTTGDSFYFLKLQVRWIAIGVAVMGFFAFYGYKRLYYVALPAMIAVVLMLLVVLVPGIGQKVGGARRWIDVGFITIQPTEFAKLATILYLASWFSSKEKSRLLPFITLVFGLMFLILLQPDMGTAIIIFALSMVMYALAGQRLYYLIGLIPVSLAGFVGLIFVAPYRLARLTAFLHPGKDPLGVGFHINQILISLSEGGILGRGFGASRQKYLFLPEAHTDSIFAIIAEELGFVGGMLLIFVYIILLYKLYQIYNATKDKFGKLLVGGIFAFFGLQIVTNLGGMVSILPLTGVPLPFVSYGGSHILTSFMLIGVAINIARSDRL